MLSRFVELGQCFHGARGILSANPPPRTTLQDQRMETAPFWCTNLNQSFAEQPVDIRPTASSTLMKLPGNVPRATQSDPRKGNLNCLIERASRGKRCSKGYGCISTATHKFPFWILTTGKPTDRARNLGQAGCHCPMHLK
jgi:hypothetical protein